MTMEERRNLLVKNLQSLVNKQFNPPKDMNKVIYNSTEKSTVLFYGFKSKEIHKLQSKFKLDSDTMEAIRVAPFLKDGGSAGFIDTQIELNLKGDLSKTLQEYQKTVGTVFKDDDYSYLVLIRVKVKIDLKIKSKKIEIEECHHVFLFFKSCTTHIEFEKLDYTPSEINTIKESAKYKAALEIKKKYSNLEDKSIQIYLSEGNSIYSNNNNLELYVSEYGDCAVGPSEAIQSIIPVRRIVYTFNGGIKTFLYGKYISYCLESDDCKEAYGGMEVYKLNFLFGRINSHSSMYVHREQMKKNQLEGPYELIVYTNGEMVYRNKDKVAIFRSNTKGKGIPPYSIDLSENGELILSDFKDNILYKSSPWKQYPGVEFKAFELRLQASYLNGYRGGSICKQMFGFSLKMVSSSMHIRYRVGYMIIDGKTFKIIYKNYADGQKTDMYFNEDQGRLYSISADLVGKESNKFKVCYQLYKYDESRSLERGWTPIYCGVETKGLALVKNRKPYQPPTYEKIMSMLVFVTDKDDKDLHAIEEEEEDDY